MIKAVTTRNTKKGDRRTLGVEVEIEGTNLELLHEFKGILDTLEDTCPEVILMGILDSLEDTCPEVILMALQMRMEEK